MSVYCQFYDNKQNLISEQIVSSFAYPIPSGAVSGLFYDNTYKIDGLKLNFNNSIFDFSFISTKDYFLYVFPSGFTHVLATSVRSSSFLSDTPELSQSDKDYLNSLSDKSSIDFSTIVTALNSITSALSALTNLTNLTNLSNLADLANIITAINNKDNQSDIVSILQRLFTFKTSENGNRIGVFTGNNIDGIATNASSFINMLNQIRNCFMYENVSLRENPLYPNKIFYIISNKLQEIETKLEQNLPFTTIVENEIVETNFSQNCNYSSKIEQIPFSE